MKKESIFKKVEMLILMCILTTMLFGFIIIPTTNSFVFYNIMDKCKDLFNASSQELPSIDSQEINFSEYKEGEGTSALFYYDSMTTLQKDVFQSLYKDICSFKERIPIKKTGVSVMDIEKVMNVLYFDCPELFHMNKEYKCDMRGENVAYIYPSYKYTREEYSRMKIEVERKSEEILADVIGDTEFDVEIKIHDYITQNTIYCIDSRNCNNIYGALIDRTANCNGYSSTFLYLLRKAGIMSAQVIGSTDLILTDANHSWNLVKIDGEFYYTDVCWDDIEENMYLTDVQQHYAFFNMTYDNILKIRNISAQKTLGEIPKDNNYTYNYYRNKGLFANNYAEGVEILSKEFLNAIAEGKNTFSFQCKNALVMNMILNNIEPILEDITSKSKITITSCKYSTVQDGNTIIIHGLNENYSKKE